MSQCCAGLVWFYQVRSRSADPFLTCAMTFSRCITLTLSRWPWTFAVICCGVIKFKILAKLNNEAELLWYGDWKFEAVRRRLRFERKWILTIIYSAISGSIMDQCIKFQHSRAKHSWVIDDLANFDAHFPGKFLHTSTTLWLSTLWNRSLFSSFRTTWNIFTTTFKQLRPSSLRALWWRHMPRVTAALRGLWRKHATHRVRMFMSSSQRP